MGDLNLTPKEAFTLCEVFWKLANNHKFQNAWTTLYDMASNASNKWDPHFMDELAAKLDEYFSGETGTITVQQPAFEDKQ